MKNEKTIFLDIDGVLATHREFMMSTFNFHKKHPEAKELRIPYPFNEGCVKIFNQIIEETDANIVLSSDWRIHWTLEELDLIFKFNGVIKSPTSITGVSKRKMSSSLEHDRTWQIENYVSAHEMKTWVAIDDLNLSKLYPKFVQTKDTEGLKQLGIKNKILTLLNQE